MSVTELAAVQERRERGTGTAGPAKATEKAVKENMNSIDGAGSAEKINDSEKTAQKAVQEKGKLEKAGKGHEADKPTALPSPEALRLQYSYELERSREISSSINRLTILAPIMIAVICLLVTQLAPMCTEHISMTVYLILGSVDVLVLLGALVVACTVHFYILNPAPSQTEEIEWMTKMKRDLQRGNNWRAWLVFAATILVYVAAMLTLAILILCLIGK